MKDIQTVARKNLWRVRAAGLPYEVEDLVQDLAMTWMEADKHYREEAGASFRTYLARAMSNRITALVGRNKKRNEIVIGSIDNEIGDETRKTFADVVSDQKDQIDTVMMFAENYDRVMARLSDRARKYVELLLQPPLEIYALIEARRARYVYARERGIKSHAQPGVVTGSIIFDLMGAAHPERVAISREIRSVIEGVSQ